MNYPLHIMLIHYMLFEYNTFLAKKYNKVRLENKLVIIVGKEYICFIKALDGIMLNIIYAD